MNLLEPFDLVGLPLDGPGASQLAHRIAKGGPMIVHAHDVILHLDPVAFETSEIGFDQGLLPVLLDLLVRGQRDQNRHIERMSAPLEIQCSRLEFMIFPRRTPSC